ncbi:DUF551 domain-containing protein [Shigella boydii]|nr:DUF551 domain-containing protein [Shigella boydii]
MELSRDKIKEIINDDWLLMDDCEGNKNCDVVKEMARIALASIEAEPVAWLLSGGGAKNNVSFDSGNAYADPLREVTPLYTAPPAPVSVPAAMEIDDDFDSAFEHGKAVGWNSCRAAMLHGAEPVSQTYKLNELSGNSPVTPDGWISCSERMPNDKQYVWCWGKSYGWTECDTFEGYYDCSRNKWWAVTDNGEEPASKVTHWMPLPEPPQEVK